MRKPLTKEERKKVRGVPPLPTFSLAALPDDVLLTQREVAAWKRESVTWVEKCRYDKRDGLEWQYINGNPRCPVWSLRQAMQNNPSMRRRGPKPPARQKKADDVSKSM